MGDAEEHMTKALRGTYHEPIEPPYRWRGRVTGGKRHELSEEHGFGSFLSFVDDELFPHLKNLGETPGASDKQKVISKIFRNKEKTILSSQINFLDAMDGVWRLSEPGFWR
ncbi:MAG: hypothetical protein U9N36_03985 [Euryarchaeota archaeon]|nr:hypothetical protein [Euryarchaeota archaeon]